MYWLGKQWLGVNRLVEFTPLHRSLAEGSRTTSLPYKPILKLEVDVKTWVQGLISSRKKIALGLGKISWWELNIFALRSNAIEDIYFSDATDFEVHRFRWGMDVACPYCATVTWLAPAETIPNLVVLWGEIIIHSEVEQTSLWDRETS